MPIAMWPELHPRQLPRSVTPFRFETVDSFITRLAHANHLSPRDLRGYSAGRHTCYPQADRLATLSGLPAQLLLDRLRGIEPADHEVGRQRAHSRPLCRFCTARRGAVEPVYCWLPDCMTVCRRHRRWIAPSARTWEDQHCLAQHPDVLRAGDLHRRLCRRHPQHVVDIAKRDAHHILVRWRRHRALADLASPSIQPQQRQPAPAYVIAVRINSYPDLVRLTGLILSHRQLLLRTAAGDPHAYRRAASEFLTKAANEFHLDRGAAELDVITTWLDDQALIGRSLDRRPRPQTTSR